MTSDNSDRFRRESVLALPHSGYGRAIAILWRNPTTLITVHDTTEATTSAMGSLYGIRSDTGPAVSLIPTALSGPATANTYAQDLMTFWAMIPQYAERTATGPTGQIVQVPAVSTAESIMEIRRRSGLNWEELGDLFGVSRRSVHNWANGKPANSIHDRTIRKTLAAVRHLDMGDQEGTRAALLAVDENLGVSRFDLLREGRIDEAIDSSKAVPELERRRIPLTANAWNERRPQAWVLLLEAEQDRPNIPAKARAVRPKRIPKKTG